ncbi:MAG: metallophosphoesterase [Sarcina sp.]
MTELLKKKSLISILSSRKILSIGILLIIFTIVYNIYDNNRIKVIETEIEFLDLPKEFEDFTILQITDLHGKEFGEKQEKLTSLINGLSYDMIAITGDIQNKHKEGIKPFLDMMDGIEDKENTFFVYGNIDEEKYFDEIKNSGCNMLEEPFEFKRGNESLWIDEYSHLKKFDKEKFSIGLTHIPIPAPVGHDLILAGHHHGGQYRIPFFGAVFIPNNNGRNLFPDQSDVSGLKVFEKYSGFEIKPFKQFISRGLGASADLKLIEFRLFNTPEINLIRLKRKVEN